jgi:ABC-2 type transport system ATP-binding protein
MIDRERYGRAMPGVQPVDVRAVSKHFGEFVALQDVTFEVRTGQVTGFLGANGAGKTTLLRVIVGLLKPTKGEVLVFGVPSTSQAARRHVGYMPADPAFFDRLTGRHNLDLLAALSGGSDVDREWACELLDLTDLQLERRVGDYSSGMKQKLGLVQAVQHHPELVILDEPANRLDPVAHGAFERLVTQIAASGRSVFLSSHALGEVESVCAEVATIREGRLLSLDRVAALAAAAMRTVKVTFDGRPDALPGDLLNPRWDGDVLVAQIRRGSMEALRTFADDPRVTDLLVEPGTLADTFLALYAKDGR